MSHDPTRVSRDRRLAFAMIVAGTVIGIAGTDLVLPAVPGMPAALGGDLARAQLVLAAFVAGSATGLVIFGSLGALFDQRKVLVTSLLAYGTVSAVAAASPSLDMLIALRFLQGAAGAAAAVFAPGIIRALFGDERAIGALGFLGSVEAMTPAFAPIAGVWLYHGFGWNASFTVIAVLAFAIALMVHLLRDRLPAVVSRPAAGGYRHLLRDPVFLRYALSQAFTLGALLVIVFAAPTVFVATLGGTLTDFIVMQLTGIATFAVAANVTGRLAGRFGAERMVWIGTVLSAAGCGVMLLYALLGGAEPLMVAAIFVPINIGLGLRGPVGFHRAVVASRGDDARGAALVMLSVLVTTAVGTAAVAPFITQGLLPLAFAATALTCLAVVLLTLLPALPESEAARPASP